MKNNSVKNSVNNNTRKHSTRTWRAATLLCAVFAGLTLARGGAAQEPQTYSPGAPTPYQSPLFHSGGADPVAPLTSTSGLTAPFGVDPLQLNPLFGQAQGTPTGLVPVPPGSTTAYYPVQIPSFLLGAYDPGRPPGTVSIGDATPTYYPEHFADGTDPPFYWNAPFDYVAQTSGLQTVDDNAGPFTAPATSTTALPGFTYTNGWEQVTTDGTAVGTFTGTNVASPAAGTATTREYLRLPFGTGGTATWQLVEPVAGNYTVNVNIPNDIPDATNAPEPRSQNVTYSIVVRDTSGAITFSGNANISQTEANANQFLAGPFQVVAGGTVTVTLQRDANLNSTDRQAGQYYIVADSVSLQVAVGDVQSTPTAINFDSYPSDFNRVQYWGIAPGNGLNIQAPNLGTDAAAAARANAIPDTVAGKPVLQYGDPVKASDALHHIRQLVYFGRREPVSSRAISVDDSQGAFTSGFVSNPVPDASATNGEYRKYGVTTGQGSLVGTWQLQVPTTAVPLTSYTVNIHLPRTQPPTPNGTVTETRLRQAAYTITDAATNALISGPVTISQQTFGTDRIVPLPAGNLTQLTPGQTIKVNLFNGTGGTTPPPSTTDVVADSVSLSSGNGLGAIYCVDGFTGGVVWRYETPSSSAGSSTPVYSSPVVAKINVLVAPAVGATPAVYANKLVVIVGDNNGLLYCLDAMGNGDGTSNFNSLDANLQPIYAPQPSYGTAVAPFDPNNPTPAHVGTTSELWVYRPDPNSPKNITTGAVKKATDVTSDLPVPAAFNTASPTVFVDPNVATVPATAGGPLASNATVYVGNSNGVLYALDALGVPTGGATLAAFQASGEKFNSSLDIRRTAGHYAALPNGGPDPLFDPTDGFVPTPQPKWWFSLRGLDPNSPDNPSFADIESAPSLNIAATITSTTVTNGVTTNNYSYAPTVFIGSSHEMEATSNVGRVYALDGTYGPSGNNGKDDPTTAAGAPGTFAYNVGQRPQISNTDTAHWSFPDLRRGRPALGNITGTPVVFTDTNEINTLADGRSKRTRVYFAANAGLETQTNGVKAATRPNEAQGGRIWAVNLDGSVGTTTNSGGSVGTNVWSFPLANDPNDATKDTVKEPSAPIGSFLHATPAMGFVQFPSTITNGDGSLYAPKDVIHTGVTGLKGQSVPMLYVGTRGATDTALYAIDVDGNGDAQRQIYREASPDGSIFQSSPILITNTTNNTNGGGNGGAVFLTGGSTFYDFSATPVPSPITAGFTSNAFPLIRLNKTYSTAGPFSAPTVAAATTTDLVTSANLTSYTTATGFTTTVTDWVYVGDSTTGFCRGFTPNDATDLGIPTSGLNALIPPGVSPFTAPDLTAPLRAYLVDEPHKISVNYNDGLKIGSSLPVYEWGQNVYIRFANVVPPSPIGTDPPVVVYNTVVPGGAAQEGQVGYGNGGPLEFTLSDSFQGTNGTDATTGDRAVIPPLLLTVPTNGNPLPNGFFLRGDNDDVNVLHNIGSKAEQAAPGKQYIAAYTYTIADGSARLNTPGSRRRILSASQTVEVYKFTGGVFRDQGTTTKLVAFTSDGNEVSTPNPGGTPPYSLTPVPPVDQPTFGILNPLGVRGGGLNLFSGLSNTNPDAIPIGDELGPFRAISNTDSTIAPNQFSDLKALANGNDIPQSPPISSAGGGGIVNPIKAQDNNNNAALNPPTFPNVVVTATSLISHNTSGENIDTSQSPLPVGIVGKGTDGLITTNFGTPAAPFAMDLFDRSALGVIGQGIRAKANTVSGGGDAGLYWNDNTATAGTDPNEHASVVNYLPWEMPPPVGTFINGIANSSQDYPNISPSNVSVILHQYDNASPADMSLGQAFLKRATTVASSTANSDPVHSRTVYGNPIEFHITVPRFQAANQQLYSQVGFLGASQTSNYQPGGQTAAIDSEGKDNTSLNKFNATFPMGYVATRRIYVPDRNGFYRQGAAFREVRVYTGVPPSYTTQMDTATASIGSVPSGFGIQTSQYRGLVDPPGVGPGTGNNSITFDPYNQQFQNYYVPLSITNTGNVNLLNVHLTQKTQDTYDGAVQPISPLKLRSDALDTTSFIPGYDPLGALTGPRPSTDTFGTRNVPEDYFLVRSSLDSDLGTAFGRNPLITQTAYNSSLYPSVTFHKAQVGSAQPSTLTVPDAPDSFVPGASLDVPTTSRPTHATEQDPNNSQQQIPFKTAPFVSVAIPFGTPVGSYSGLIYLFEGLDKAGYSPLVTNAPGGTGTYTGLTAQIFPPHYGNATGGIARPTTDNYGRLIDPSRTGNIGGNISDTIETVTTTNPNGTKTSASLMPHSANATVLNVKVLEDRMTDGSTIGAVPMIDQPKVPGAAPTLPASFPDFAPAAFRDPTTGNLSVYWTSGRVNPGYGIYSATAPVLPGTQAFMPVDPTSPGTPAAPNYVDQWWTSLGNSSIGYTGSGASRTLVPAIPTNQGTNSGLSIVQDAQYPTTVGAFVVNVQGPPLAGVNSYQNTLLYYPVTRATGTLGTPQVVTNDPSQVKYGARGVSTNTAFSNQNPNLWAFWTATTRGRTAIYYNSLDPATNLWIPASGATTPSTIGLLTIPAGLTAVADPAPLLVYGNVQTSTGPQLQATVEVTYSGTAPTGNVDLYQSRYQPETGSQIAGQPKPKPYQLDLVPYPAVTEILASKASQPGGWYQARDVAWSRTNQLNLFVQYVNSNGVLTTTPLLYDTANGNRPLFSRATFDKASGLLVVTGVTNPALNITPATQAFGNTNAPVTAYIDLATGRVRFSATPNVTLTALFSPLARRLTDDSRADTGPVTFLDGAQKPDDAGLFLSNGVTTDRRWYIWRKSGAGGAAAPATIYYKTQRLTVFLPTAVDTAQPISISLNGTPISVPYDVLNVPAVYRPDGKTIQTPATARIYFPIKSGAEGAVITGSYSYTPPGGTATTQPISGTVQWQDEIRANDAAAPIADTLTGLANINQGYLVPMETPVNENNVAAFLDPTASLNTEHKVWLFWNSTRNGTADIYYETINPLFAAAP